MKIVDMPSASTCAKGGGGSEAEIMADRQAHGPGRLLDMR